MQKSHPSPHEHILHEKGGSGRIRAQHCHLGGQEASWGRSAGRLQHSAMVKARLRTQAIIAVQLLSLAWLFVTPWTAARQASLSFPISWSFLKLMSIESMMPSNHLILSSHSPPALSLCQHQGLFQWVDSSHQVTKVLELQLQRQSFQWIFRIDFL